MGYPADGFGVYIHYPWCRHRCPYCDFAIAVDRGAGIPNRQYSEAVLSELEFHAPQFEERRLASIYIGGGTPSLWPVAELARVLEGVTARFSGVPLEITLEANPSDCHPDNLSAWQQVGISRLSVGVQSVHAADLVVLGRDHRMGEGRAALRACSEAGLQTFSADLMLSVPGADIDPGVDELADFGVPHVSVYELTVEERTPLAAAVSRGEVVPLEEDERERRYLAVREALVYRGYEHYEVSSFAKPGHRSVHNAAYWRAMPCLALGNGAASLLVGPDGSGRRWVNHRSVGRYMAAPSGHWAAETEDISPGEMRRDRLWLGLRTSLGVRAELCDEAPGVLDWLLEHRLAVVDEGRIRPTFRGYLQHDAVVRRVVTSFRYTSAG